MPKPIPPKKHARKGFFRGYKRGPNDRTGHLMYGSQAPGFQKLVWMRSDQARAIMDHRFYFKDVIKSEPNYIHHNIEIVPLLAGLTSDDVLKLICRMTFRGDPYFAKARDFYVQQRDRGYAAAFELNHGVSGTHQWLKRMTRAVKIEDQTAIMEGKRTRRLSAQQRVARDTRYSEP